MGSMIVSSCRSCKFVSCVLHVAVLNAAFYITCILLMLDEDARGDHMEDAYCRAGLMNALWIAMSFLPYIPGNIPNTPMQHGYKHNTLE